MHRHKSSRLIHPRRMSGQCRWATVNTDRKAKNDDNQLLGGRQFRGLQVLAIELVLFTRHKGGF